MSVKRVAVIGTVGVPARYGGFETLAEQLARHVLPTHHRLYIYCQRSAYGDSERTGNFHGHRCIYVPLKANGGISMLYDAVSMFDAVLIRRCSTILCLGVSGAFLLPLLRLLVPGCKIILNVDGLESRRTVWSRSAQLLLASLERIGVKTAHEIVSDNRVIRTLVRRRYGRSSRVIAYGGDHASPSRCSSSEGRGFGSYFLSISRIVPENNVALILAAFARAGLPLVYIGNWDVSAYARAMRQQFGQLSNIKLIDPIYDDAELGRWREGAIAYVHGHSVGGTNPSLVEALFWAQSILAFDCGFNRATLENHFHYWSDAKELTELVTTHAALMAPSADSVRALRARYRWTQIAAEYEALFT